MFEPKDASRVVIVVDAVLKPQIVEKIFELGASGYNCVECTGKGVHSISGDLFSSNELVRIEVITSEEIAAKILGHLHAVQFQQFGRYALMAFLDHVQVDARDRTIKA